MSLEYSSTIAGIVQKLETRDPLPPLAPREEWDSELTHQIQDLSSKSSQWKPHALAWGGNCAPFLVEIAGKIWYTSFVFRRGFQPSAPLLASPTPR